MARVAIGAPAPRRGPRSDGRTATRSGADRCASISRAAPQRTLALLLQALAWLGLGVLLLGGRRWRRVRRRDSGAPAVAAAAAPQCERRVAPGRCRAGCRAARWSHDGQPRSWAPGEPARGARPGRAGAAKGRRVPVVIVLVGLLAAAISAGDRRDEADAGLRTPTVAASMPATGCAVERVVLRGRTRREGREHRPRDDLQRREPTGADRDRHDGRRAQDDLASRDGRRAQQQNRCRCRSVALAGRRGRRPTVRTRRRGRAGVLRERRRRDGALRDAARRPAGISPPRSTGNGAQQWLSLLNPFSVDSVVDVEAFTETGFRAPGSLQGLVVPHASRLSVRVRSGRRRAADRRGRGSRARSGARDRRDPSAAPPAFGWSHRARRCRWARSSRPRRGCSRTTAAGTTPCTNSSSPTRATPTRPRGSPWSPTLRR